MFFVFALSTNVVFAENENDNKSELSLVKFTDDETNNKEKIYDKKHTKRAYKHKDTIEPELHHENSSMIYNFENFINEIYRKQ